MKNKIIIFSDGASKGNPGPGGWGTVVVDGDRVTELGGAEKHTTNNRMELLAALEGLRLVSDQDKDIIVNTDSRYVVNGMTGWIYGWQKNNWQTKGKTAVLNQDLWQKLAEIALDKKIQWNYIGGHIGVAGNERCDEIASAMALGEEVKLYKGALSDYKINILDLGHSEEKKTLKNNKGAKAYSYLSLVDGILNIDKSWADCESRVKGKKGAKFQKAISEDHQKEILKSWGQNEQ